MANYQMQHFLEIVLLVLLSVELTFSSSIHQITGSVPAGNYTYFVLKTEGRVFLELTTLEGDADLYISDVKEQPTFELHEHSLSSWTCGVDVIDVPSSFGRPINIGVYGHPRFEESHFVLKAQGREEEYDHFRDDPEEYADRRRQSDESDQEEDNESSPMWTILWWVLEIALEILSAL